MNKEILKIDREISDDIERRFYIIKSYESLLSVICKSYSETPTENYRNMIEDYRKLYQKAQIEFSYARDTLFNQLAGGIPSYYKFDFDKQEVECEW